MKKITVLGIIFFIVFPQIFADENPSFSWQLYNQENNQKINFMNLNPVFFNNNYVSINYFENISRYNNFHSKQHINTQENGTYLYGIIFSTVIYTGAIFTGWSMSYGWSRNMQEREIHNDMWKQQKETEDIYRRLYSDPTRNFYQGNY